MKKIRDVVKVSCAAACTLLVTFCASGANRIWSGGANDGGIWGTAGNWAENAVPVAADVAIFNSSGGTITVAVNNNHTVQQIQNNGTADVVINIDANMTLTVSNTGITGIQARGANTTINGPGLLALSTGGDMNPLDCGALLGFTLTYNAQIVAPGGGPNTSVETYVITTYDAGTVVMGYPLNAFTGPNVLVGGGHTLVVPTLANKGQISSIGAGNTFYFTYLATLRYTGTGDSTDRDFLLNGSGGGQVEHAGTGPLLFTGPVYNINNSAQTFVLRGDSSSEARITGPIYNNTGTLAVRKEGTGTWVLGGNNSFTGGLTVNGGTLGLDSPTAFGASTSITMANGTTLSINPSGKDFSAVLPTIVAPASGSIALSVADALNTSSVTLNGLNGAFNVAISAPGAGTAANRIFIPGLPSGPVGAWLTLNSGVAQYDQANGLSPVTLSSGTLATKGNALPDGPTVQALIDTIGAGPDIWLDYNPTTLFSLTMGVSGGDALVNLAGKTLWASELAIASGAGALTIGASRNDGTLAPPTAPQQKAVLTLRNDSAADLTVNAAITPPPDSIVSLVKTGTGNATLAGSTTLAGFVLIDSGTLAFHIPSATLDTLYGVTSGNGKLVKDGPGMLALPLAVANQHTGGTDILAGTVRVGQSRSLGTGPVTIADGATLDVGGSTTATSIVLNNPVTVSGAGVDNKGAIVNSSTLTQMNAFQNTTVTLAGDTTFGGTARWDFRMGITLDLGGNTFTKTGGASLNCFGAGGTCSILNVPDKSIRNAFDIQQGELHFETAVTLSPNDNLRNINIAPAARFGMYNLSTPINWTFTTGNASEIYASGGNEGTNANVVTGEVAINGQLRLTANGNFNKILKGPITGDGGLSVYNIGAPAMSLLMHPANTFTGPVAVSNACLGLFHAGSLPDFSELTLAQSTSVGAAVRVYMGDSGGWTTADVKQLAETPGLFNTLPSWNHLLQINVGPGESASFPALNGTLLGSVDKFGAGDLAFDYDTTLRWGVRTFGGGIVFTNDATFALENLNNSYNHIYTGDTVIADGTAGLGSVLVGGKAKVILSDNGYDRAGPRIHVATHGTSKIVMDVKDEAYVQAALIVGGTDNNASDARSVGAVYQSGNSKWLNTGGANNDSRIGRHGYGYYQLAGNAEMTVKGWFNIGNPAGTTSPLGIGIFRQTGGTFIFNGSRNTLPSGNNVGESYGGRVDVSRGGIGILHLSGGTFEHYGPLNLLADSSELSNNSGTAIMTVDGDADVWTDRQIEMGRRNSGLAILNLNGGDLTTTYIYRRTTPSTTTPSSAFINLNGGNLRVTTGAGDVRLFARENVANHLGVYVYDGGAKLDIHEGLTRDVDVPLQHPQGMGITSIPLTSGGTGYVAPPHVAISGGNGTGATAIAHIDRLSGTVTGIEVTCPGFGYTTPPTVTLTGGGGTGASVTDANVVRTANIGGGLTKTGRGTLTLSAANSYQGATRINGGTLLLAHPQVIPETSEIILADGATLDLGGAPHAGLIITGNGTVINGVSGSGIILSPADDNTPGTMSVDGIGSLDGVTYRVTIHDGLAPGQVCDVITSTGTLDLTGLTIVPSDVISEKPAGTKYVIATATGGFTGTPTIEGFTDGRKWKTLRKGNELWLTTLGGTVLILR